MPAFHEVRFPELISWGATGGPEFETTVVIFSSGKEQRDQRWEVSRLSWDVAHGVKEEADFEVLLGFFRARRGRAHGFRFQDFSDFQLEQEVLQNSADDTFVGDGFTTVFNVVKRYEITSEPPASAAVNTEVRRLFKLRGGAGDPLSLLTEAFRVDGSPVTPASVDRNAGTVTFTVAPSAGDVADMTGEFDVPVRFDIDQMAINVVDFNANTWSGIIVRGINPLLEP